MTTGLVTGFGAISELTNVVNASAKAASDNGSSFSDYLKANTDKGKEPAEIKSSKPSDGKQNDSDNVGTDRPDCKTYEKVADGKKSVEAEEDITDEVISTAAQASVLVADILNVTAQDVESALEALDISETALLDIANIPEVVVEIAGAEDTTAIMTDENLYNNVKDITGQVNELLSNLEEETGIAIDDIKDAISKMNNGEENALNIQNAEAEEIKPEITDIRGGQKKDTDNNQQGAEMGWTESVIEGIKAAAGEQVGEVAEAFTTDMSDIYEQVSESMKLNLSEDVTEMEMNLHPASLGNVKIQIAAKDGVITANFTTQNETVKAALETQLVQLKENMAEQGIKVEAIEVAVAAHAFDENLSKEGESRSSEQPETKKRRSININDLTEDDDILIDDAEAIARDMMIKNGTTVDYMA